MFAPVATPERSGLHTGGRWDPVGADRSRTAAMAGPTLVDHARRAYVIYCPGEVYARSTQGVVRYADSGGDRPLVRGQRAPARHLSPICSQLENLASGPTT
jgi:hypothetical protein